MVPPGLRASAIRRDPGCCAADCENLSPHFFRRKRGCAARVPMLQCTRADCQWEPVIARPNPNRELLMNQSESDPREVVHRVIRMIRDECLAPGARLPGIRELSDKWRIGRNAVRDGLLRAQLMGLVRIEPRSGAYVRKANFASNVDLLADTLETALIHEDSSIFDVIAARRMIETEIVAEVAAMNRPQDLLPIYEELTALEALRNDRHGFIEADERFHLGLAEIGGNKVLLTLLRAIMILLRPFRMQLEADSEKWLRIEQTHWEIYKSILDGNVEAGRAAMREHLSDDREQALAMMRKLP